jgi:hypothetical protein
MGRVLVSLAASAMLAGVVAGCGSHGQTQDSAVPSDDGSFPTCAADTRAMPYQPGMHVTSAAGAFTIKLLDSSPGPPVKGTNTWNVEIDDAQSGAPLDGLAISVMPWMPDHGHGTSAQVGVMPAGGGTYTLMPVYLYMSGFWQVKMSITETADDAGTADNGVLPICIP